MTEFEVILKHYNLLESTQKYKIVCPFHADVNASMMVNVSDNYWHCFGCEKSGDGKALVKEFEQCTDLKAMMIIKQITKGTKITTFSKHDNDVHIDFDHLKRRAEDYYFNLKTTDWSEDSHERDYLLNRGLTEDILHRSRAKQTFNDSYPIIFPITDNGKFAGWVSRTTTKSIEEKRKYLYNEGFRRKQTLAGRYKSGSVFIVEGYFDYLKLRQFGEDNAVAILGWKITDEQVKKLKDSGVKTVISALDNDECGRKGTQYLKNFFNVIEFKYPPFIENECLLFAKDIGEMSHEYFKKAKELTINEWYLRLNKKRNKQKRRVKKEDSLCEKGW